MLDVDHGTYPFVTSSNTVAASGVPPAAGMGPSDDRLQVLGISKGLYATRVGAGPFPTAIQDPEQEERLRALGGEYGATTGRPRRCGWFDAPLVRRAVLLNGTTHIALTKLDVLSDYGTLKLCVAYAGDEVPGQGIAPPEPVYEELEGWGEDISGVRSWEGLPTACQRYVERIEELVGAPVALLSVGPGRDEVIARDPEFSALLR